MLADALGFPFIELSCQIEAFAGCSISEIHNLYGTNAYRRYERRALEEADPDLSGGGHRHAGRAGPDAANFNFAAEPLHHRWLQATPEDHMNRVAAQGDLRPMAASREAMDDLRRILAGLRLLREGRLTLDTSAQDLAATFACCRRGWPRQHRRRPDQPAASSVRAIGRPKRAWWRAAI